MVNKKLTMAALTLLFAFTSVSYANPIRSNSSTKFTISDKVGKNQFEWTSTAPAETISGTAEGISGQIIFDPNNPSSLNGEIKATVATMQTGNKSRDGHLQGEKWLDAAKYPFITFTALESTNVKKNGSKFTADVIGNFSLHGVTKKITVPVEITVLKANAETAKRAPGDLMSLTAELTVSLKDFAVKGTEGTIGKNVGETISIKAKIFASNGITE
jgi:polyisoprenoid-binding protein YceI